MRKEPVSRVFWYHCLFEEERTSCFYVNVLKVLLHLDVLAMSDLVVGHVCLSARQWNSMGDQQNTISILNMYVCIQFELHHILDNQQQYPGLQV